MKQRLVNKFLFLFLLFLSSTLLNAQDLTGIWRGKFFTPQDMIFGTVNRYEVQIDNNSMTCKGVTYSYQNTSFYGKATLVGIWKPAQKNLIFREEKLVEYKTSSGDNEIYLFTCILEYRKEGNKEILEGDYTSKHYKNKKDGGGGHIYLERVTDSDFEKEDFIIKKEKTLSKTKKIKPGAENAVINKQKTMPEAPPVMAKPKPVTPPVAIKPKPKPVTPPVQPKVIVPDTKTQPPVVSIKPIEKIPNVKTLPPAPKVIAERENELVQIIYTNAKEIEVSLYDNGEIDGDTITVYDNNKQIAWKKGLSTKPITFKINLSEDDEIHEIVMVADNLGSIPPNTALMIVQAGDKRYTVRLASTIQKNAMVRFKYKAN